MLMFLLSVRFKRAKFSSDIHYICASVLTEIAPTSHSTQFKHDSKLNKLNNTRMGRSCITRVNSKHIKTSEYYNSLKMGNIVFLKLLLLNRNC